MHELDFFETFKILNNKIINFKFHQNRILNTLSYLEDIKKVKILNKKNILKDLNNEISLYFNTLILNKNRLRIDFKILNNKINLEYSFSKLKLANKEIHITINNKATINSKNTDHNYKFNYLNHYYKESNNDLLKHYDDVILSNEKNELCESTKANIYILKDEQFLTPASRCGVLNGTYRNKLLSRNKIIINNKYYKVKEALIYSNSLKNSKLFISNALIGLIEIKNPLVT